MEIESQTPVIILLIITLFYVWLYYGSELLENVCNDRHDRYVHHGVRVGNAIAPLGRSIVYFSRSTCGYCQRFDPVWNEFKRGLVGGDITAYNIVCDNPENQRVYEWARENLDLKSVPHIVKLDGVTSTAVIYTGPRTVVDLQAFVL